MILFDISPIPAGVGFGLAAVFFLICAVIAFVSFKMLKRTVKMAVRMTIVAVILLIALIGGVSLLYFNSGSNGGNKPPIQQKR
jgi:peptidoglycan/LPS O-acetylase OafA/YrhL